jgi:hypothetical protein
MRMGMSKHYGRQMLVLKPQEILLGVQFRKQQPEYLYYF